MRDACHALQEDEAAAAAPSPEDGEAASPLEDGDESMVMTGELEMLNEDIRAKEEAMANMCRSALHMHYSHIHIHICDYSHIHMHICTIVIERAVAAVPESYGR